MVPLRSDLESACESLTGNARKIMQVISEDPGITIESLATLVKLTPYGIRCHLAGLAKSVGLHHSSDRKGGVWEVTGSKNRAQETTTETTREVSPQTSKETTIETTQETTIETTIVNLGAGTRVVYEAILSEPTNNLEQIAEKTGMTRDGVFYHVKVLRKELGLRHEGPTKKGRWVFGPKPNGTGRGK